MSSRLVYGSVARSINSLVTPWSPSLIELAWLMIMKVLVESFDCLLMKGRERGRWTPVLSTKESHGWPDG